MDKSKNTENNPEKLIQGTQDGDEGSFEALYNLYYTPIYRYLYIRTKNKDTATDLTQTVFMKIFSSINTYKNIGKSPLSFFFTIARNTLIDHYRKEGHGMIYNDDIVANTEEKIDDTSNKEDHDTLLQAIKTLTTDQAEVITLRFLNDLPSKDVAQIVGKNEEAVRQLQSRGIRALRDYFIKNNLI